MNQDERVIAIANYLGASSEQLVREKALWKSPEIKCTPEEFSKMMKDAFFEAIKSDREDHLAELTRRLSRVYAERNELENQFANGNLGVEDSCSVLDKQNEELKTDVERLEGDVKGLEWKHNRKTKSYQDKIKVKNDHVTQINKVAESVLQAHQTLSAQLDELKRSSLRLQRGQLRLCRQAKTMLITQIEESVEEQAQQNSTRHTREVSRMSTALSEEKANLREAERQAKLMLDGLSDMGVRVCSVEDLGKRASAVKDSIDEVIDRECSKALDKVRRDLESELPGIELRGANIADAVQRYLNDQIRAKEKECQEMLRKGEARERKLRQKLDEAIMKIQRLQDSRSQDMGYLDEFERSKRAYEEQQKRLDERMNALSLGK